MKTPVPAACVLLGFLLIDKLHGYEIRKSLVDELNDIWHIGSSQIYQLLQKLEQQGWVVSVSEATGNRPPKKVFHITDAGRAVFMAWVQKPTRHVRDLRIEFLTKLYFFRRLALAGGDNLMREQKDILADLKKKIIRRHSQETDSYSKLVLSFKIAQIDVCLQWLREQAEPYLQALEQASGTAFRRSSQDPSVAYTTPNKTVLIERS